MITALQKSYYLLLDVVDKLLSIMELVSGISCLMLCDVDLIMRRLGLEVVRILGTCIPVSLGSLAAINQMCQLTKYSNK